MRIDPSSIPEGWAISLLGSLTKRGSGHTPDKQMPEYWDGGVKWVSLADSRKLDKGLIYDTDKEISELGIANSSAVLHPAGTVVLSRDAGVGKSAVLASEMAVSQHFIAWRCGDEAGIDNWFLYYWLQKMKPEFERQAVGSTIKTIGLPYFKKLKIVAPCLSEQIKIAKVLSTWDEAATTTEKLIQNSKAQKQALMQQLLSGKKRLPGFNKPWKEVHIGDLLKEVKRRVEWRDSSTYNLLSVKRRSGGVVLRESLKGHQILTKKMNVARSGDFIISKMQVLHGASALVGDGFDGMHISDSYIATVARSSEAFDINFFDWLSRTKLMYHKAYLSSYGVHIEKMTFNFNMYLKEKVMIPPTREEQERIVAVLNLSEEKISALERKRSALKEEKKALMQQLLTGKHRMNVEEEIAEAV